MCDHTASQVKFHMSGSQLNNLMTYLLATPSVKYQTSDLLGKSNLNFNILYLICGTCVTTAAWLLICSVDLVLDA